MKQWSESKSKVHDGTRPWTLCCSVTCCFARSLRKHISESCRKNTRGKHFSFGVYYPLIKTILLSINFLALPVYPCECFVSSCEECMTEWMKPLELKHQASTGLNQWAVNLYLGDVSWSLGRIACSAVARIRLKAKILWSDAPKSQAICISQDGPITLQ